MHLSPPPSTGAQQRNISTDLRHDLLRSRYEKMDMDTLVIHTMSKVSTLQITLLLSDLDVVTKVKKCKEFRKFTVMPLNTDANLLHATL